MVDSARQIRRFENTFITDHLRRWMPDLSNRIHEQMPGYIYANFSSLVNTWIRMEYSPGYFAELKE
jgi:TorA maturation chaperone TorD